MRIPLTLPELDVHGEAVRVSGWLVDRGEFVIAGDRVVEVLLAGVTFDVEAARSGMLVEITKPVDAVVARGETLCWLDLADDEAGPVEEKPDK